MKQFLFALITLITYCDRSEHGIYVSPSRGQTLGAAYLKSYLLSFVRQLKKKKTSYNENRRLSGVVTETLR